MLKADWFEWLPLTVIGFIYVEGHKFNIFIIINTQKYKTGTVTNNNNKKSNKQKKILNRPTLQTGNSFENYKSLKTGKELQTDIVLKLFLNRS